MDRLPTDLSLELAELRARLAALEAERATSRRLCPDAEHGPHLLAADDSVRRAIQDEGSGS